jgi:hypothetical protein
MTPSLRASQDLWAGAMLIATGAAAALVARGYPFGTVRRMGPGYFPTALGCILVLFGAYFVVRALRARGGEPILGPWPVRALVVLPLALVLFGILMARAGFIPALAVLIVGSASAGKEFRLVEVLLLTAALILFAVAVFVWGLGLPYPLIAGR